MDRFLVRVLTDTGSARFVRVSTDEGREVAGVRAWFYVRTELGETPTMIDWIRFAG